MGIPQIESLLLQEMEDVRGGLAGTCECDTGAGQAGEEGGTCVCIKGAGQFLNPLPPPTCVCGTTGGAGQ